MNQNFENQQPSHDTDALSEEELLIESEMITDAYDALLQHISKTAATSSGGSVRRGSLKYLYLEDTSETSETDNELQPVQKVMEISNVREADSDTYSIGLQTYKHDGKKYNMLSNSYVIRFTGADRAQVTATVREMLYEEGSDLRMERPMVGSDFTTLRDELALYQQEAASQIEERDDTHSEQ